MWVWWQSLPSQIREPVKSAVIATTLSAQTAFWVLLGAAVQAGSANDPQTLLTYFWNHAWGVAIGVVLPAAYRARQGRIAAENTVALPNGSSAVLIPPKGK